uniref:Uncharacterized protein n=1 Tax=Glossina austeni TaxID=7395 RepID=A0A1A9UTV5_GLOAU
MNLNILASLLLISSGQRSLAASGEAFTSQHEFNESNEFYKKSVNEFVKLNQPIAESFANILDKVVDDLQDLNQLDPYSATINSLAYSEMSKKLRAYHKNEDKANLETALDICGLFITYVDVDKVGENADDVYFKLFVKNGIKELNASFKARFKEYFDKFTKDFQQYLQTFNENERRDHKKVFDWFEEFQKEDDRHPLQIQTRYYGRATFLARLPKGLLFENSPLPARF